MFYWNKLYCLKVHKKCSSVSQLNSQDFAIKRKGELFSLLMVSNDNLQHSDFKRTWSGKPRGSSIVSDHHSDSLSRRICYCSKRYLPLSPRVGICIYEKEVVDYIKKMTPLLSISIILDGLQAVLSGNFILNPCILSRFHFTGLMNSDLTTKITNLRSSKRWWMAANSSVRQSWSLLSGGNSGFFTNGIYD